jgi:hypothetical protein
LFGLSYAQQAGAAGATGLASTIQRAIDFLYSTLATPDMSSEPWQLDRLALVHFALAWAGQGDLSGASALYEVRDQLSPWAQALLALTFERLAPGEARAGTLLSDLQATAVRSATGTHWEDPNHGWQNMSTPVYTTGVVVYALAQRDPASPLLPEAVRYLMLHRQAKGSWASTYETAWTLLGLVHVIQGTGELAVGANFSATLNGTPVARGQVGAPDEIQPVAAAVPAEDLYPNDPNALVLHRDSGAGRLYYTASLSVASPVASAAPLNQGMALSRLYYPSAEAVDPITSAQPGDLVTVRLTLALPNDAYYLIVEDYLPAGAEILDTNLQTSQLGFESEPPPLFDVQDPWASGWGRWFFHQPQVYADRIAWAADYVPAGTYELTYTLVIVHPGQYGVLPARAWQFYFPEVQGSSAGTMFEIK